MFWRSKHFHRLSSVHSIIITQSEFNLIAPIFQTTQNVAIMSPMVKMKLKAITCSTEARRQHLASPIPDQVHALSRAWLWRSCRPTTCVRVMLFHQASSVRGDISMSGDSPDGSLNGFTDDGPPNGLWPPSGCLMALPPKALGLAS